ncbi:trehalose operon repressor [Lachnoclostridium sp. An131]|jgi:GntR family trehalose operon transcriptional repressor|uniref:trehalose operon repressor n=1 Tax=Lachnoclostridium sp. An131 TaxID=1965555 RepID=UPI000B3959BD|nr:trehalose operon repressor [Lachnoclostridium sp. An131]OUQ23340.1 trehalose operon repressor [Lachnoclostridium sp. An131]
MPKAKYDYIYRDLKEKIETESYSYQDLLPSEHILVQEYGCSRNTVRRALAELAADGYVQPMQGKGVRNIFQPVEQTAFTVGGIESFLESAARNHQKPKTRVLQFAELETNEKISRRTGFSVGTQLYYLQRLRYLDGIPLILDHNYFLKELIPGLTPEIAEHSIYEYLEQDLGFTISTSKRTMTVEHVTQIDETYLDMNDYNCMAVITSQTFNADGIQFEYTQSRHRPDHFQFQDVATRKKGG